MSLETSIPQRLAAESAYRDYNKYVKLVKAMGKTEEVCIDRLTPEMRAEGLESWEPGNIYPMHPIFLLAEHFRGHDGYGNGDRYVDFYSRGDILVVPTYTEYGKVYFIGIGFHKGETRMRLLRFVNPPEGANEALLDFITSLETR